VEWTKFGDLVGIFHPATGDTHLDAAVLICPPIAHEHIRAHRALRFLATQLARAGLDVLRFDYFGVGDSAGASGEGRVARWQDDVASAADELLALSGARSLSVLGMRFGATLAATASLSRLDHLVLWDPVLSGAQYLAHLERTHQAMLEDPRCFQKPRCDEPAGDDLLGFPYPPELRAEIASYDLLGLARWPSQRVTVVQGGAAPETDILVDRLARRNLLVNWHKAVAPIDWDDADAVGHSLTAGDAQGVIVQALREAPA
jgi:pimeloyl-ACP methyl ester carboxylesterase